jgi:hypothetical protein
MRLAPFGVGLNFSRPQSATTQHLGPVISPPQYHLTILIDFPNFVSNPECSGLKPMEYYK